MTAAENLANELAAELDVVTCERDDLKLQLDEAQAVIDAVRKVRDEVDRQEAAASALWCTFHLPTDRGCLESLQFVKGALSKVDGL